jgi:hypothetical protein
MAFDFNPITGQLDLVGSGGSAVIDGEVATPADLPITLGTPAIGSTYLCLGPSGVWLVNYKSAGLYQRVANAGAAADWQFIGAFPGTLSDDLEIIDATKGIIFRNSLGERVRFTMGNDRQLVRTLLPLLMLLGFAASSPAQIERDLGLDASNRVVTGITNGNPVTFTNGISLLNADSEGTIFFHSSMSNNVSGAELDFEAASFFGNWSFSGAPVTFYSNVVFSTLTNATPQNLRVTTNGVVSASANIASGNSAQGAMPEADGAGGSAWVAKRVVARGTTNNQSKTNWNFNQANQPSNNDTQMGSWAIDASSTYRVEYIIGFQTSTNAQFGHGFAFATNYSSSTVVQRYGWAQAQTGTLTAITANTNSSLIQFVSTGSSSTTNVWVAGTALFYSGTNTNTAYYRWYPLSNNADVCTLLQGSTVILTKLWP